MKRIVVAALAALIAADVRGAVTPESPEVWMAVLPVQVLGENTADWNYVLHHVDGLKFWRHQIDSATVEQLRPLVRILAEHDIDIVIENNPPWPGPVDDGIGARAAKAEIARIDKVAQAGGKVAAIDVDGPVRRLFYPDYPRSFAHGNMDIAWCVRQFIAYMKAVRKAHPHVDFYVLTNFPNWGYKGGPAYWGADQDDKRYNWGDYWPVLKALVEMTKEAGVPAYFPHISRRLSPNIRWAASSAVIGPGNAQQSQDSPLQPGQFRRERHRRPFSRRQRVPLHVLEQVNHAPRRRAAAGATLRVQRQALHTGTLHRPT